MFKQGQIVYSLGKPLLYDNGIWKEVVGNIPNVQVEVIENHELIKVLAKGIRDHYDEQHQHLVHENRQKENAEINNDAKLKKLYEINSEYGITSKSLKAKKWYQTTNHLEKYLEYLNNEARDLVHADLAWYQNQAIEDVKDAVYYYKNSISNKYSIRNQSPTQNTIISILLSTPDFKSKTFKELVVIINEQTRSNTGS